MITGLWAGSRKPGGTVLYPRGKGEEEEVIWTEVRDVCTGSGWGGGARLGNHNACSQPSCPHNQKPEGYWHCCHPQRSPTRAYSMLGRAEGSSGEPDRETMPR